MHRNGLNDLKECIRITDNSALYCFIVEISYTLIQGNFGPNPKLGLLTNGPKSLGEQF